MLEKVQTPEKSPTSTPHTHGATLAGIQVPAVLQTARLCAHLGVNSSTIWRWIRERNFPKPIEVGAKVRMWKTAEVDAWLNGHSTASQPAQPTRKGAGHD